MENPVDHRKLFAWQEAIRLVKLVYRETAGFPRDEIFGLTSQLRRSAVSIPANQSVRVGKLLVGLRKSIVQRNAA